jgi:hypothetical protein
MTGRLASRSADAEALLARFIEASEAALAALDHGDEDALARALDVRGALQQEIDRALRDVSATRARFAPDATGGGSAQRVVDRAVQQYCAPLEELARVAQVLQQRLESSASRRRDGLLGEIASLENAAGVATRYTTAADGARRFDVVL